VNRTLPHRSGARGVWGAIALMAATVGFYAWYAGVSAARPAVVAPADSPIAGAVQADLYALQAAGFYRHHLSLDQAVPPELIAAAQPYDPTQRPSVYYLHDASYFRGRYYLYFGPAPALALFLPFRALTGADLSSTAATAILCSGAYLGMVALFFAVAGAAGFRPRFDLLTGAVLVTLGGATLLLPLLRRAAVYEVAIAGGAAFALWAFFCVVRLPRSGRPAVWAGAAGFLLSLAVASRPTYFFAFLPLAAGILLLRRQRSRSGRIRDLTWASALFGLGIVGLLLYNERRFGDPFEFGQRYQLSSALEGSLRHFSLSYLPFQIRTYLFSGLEYSRYFPFVQAVRPAVLPGWLGGYDFPFGVLASLPAAAFAVYALVDAAVRPRQPQADLIFVLGGVLLAGLLPILMFFGSCVRYLADFTPMLMVIASLGMFRAAGAGAVRHRPSARARWIPRLAAAAAVWSFAIVFLVSVDMYDHQPATPPAPFERLGQVLNLPVRAWHQLRGSVYGPRQLTVRFPARNTGSEPLIAAADATGHSDEIRVEYLGPRTIRFAFSRDGAAPIDRSAPIALDRGQPHQLLCSLGGLYPPRGGELAQSLTQRQFTALRTWFHLEIDGRTVWEIPVEPATTRTEKIAVGRSLAGSNGASFTGQILASSVLPPSSVALARPAIRGVAAVLTLDSAMAGRSFPLAATGQAGTGNFLLLAVGRDGMVRFGYDHWGKPTLWSSAVPADFHAAHRIEFWMPSVLAQQPPLPLIVKWDGRLVWREPVPYFPADRNEVFVGRNPFGGTTCEPVLINAVIESTDLPVLPDASMPE